MNTKTVFTIAIIMTAGLVISTTTTNIMNFAFADKSPQAECIKKQNQGFVGKEQGECLQN